jgi:hypothetical protein
MRFKPMISIGKIEKLAIFFGFRLFKCNKVTFFMFYNYTYF